MSWAHLLRVSHRTPSRSRTTTRKMTRTHSTRIATTRTMARIRTISPAPRRSAAALDLALTHQPGPGLPRAGFCVSRSGPDPYVPVRRFFVS
ncbi:DUF3073 domain containing protein [Streptomyces microflavus DSM 40593]|uniref:DUF3073 domain containing protein n=1 Tax=Streptomyces microflavus DSM 40593 TaxID=1303692 RepID=N0CRG3_STRMI|nr:DUF3073 domain containing protein [Streptomyces microflavus DSM 40593]